MDAIIESQNVWNIIRETLSRVDSRLVDHGERVAYIALRILQASKVECSKEGLKAILLLCLLHDIGAYKTEEIDRMVEFESGNIWEHSIYGYQYLQKLSPLSEYAEAILYHHTNYKNLLDHGIGGRSAKMADLIHFSDRVDILLANNVPLRDLLPLQRGTVFSPGVVDVFLSNSLEPLLARDLKNGSYRENLHFHVLEIEFSMEERRRYLEMLAYSIDFRSEYMVLHTITTVSASVALGRFLGLSEERQKKLRYGALLHDIGKVATPVEILEKAGSLTPEEYRVMKRHVVHSGEILGGLIDQEVYRIAVRHHEKMNGTGYPLGLTAEQLSSEERICAVADVISALIRKRSYKAAYSAEHTIKILQNMAQANELCQEVIKAVAGNYDYLMEEIDRHGEQTARLYQAIKTDYQRLLGEAKAGLLPLAEKTV